MNEQQPTTSEVGKVVKSLTKSTSSGSSDVDLEYTQFEQLIARRVVDTVYPLFETDATGLWEAYLAGIPEQYRQHYNCNCCRRFIEKYGGLVAIDPELGHLHPILWEGYPVPNGAPKFFHASIYRLQTTVFKAKVTGIFLSADPVWGVSSNVEAHGGQITNRWTHLSGINPNIWKEKVKTAFQAMAEKREEHHMLCRALAEIPKDAAIQAVRVLEADVVDRGEKTLGNAKWFLDLHDKIKGAKGNKRDNVIWLAVALAPPGWCHIRSGILSTLLDDIIAGLDFEAIRRRWNAKMHPLQYQRPTALPADGLIKQANELVEKLGCRKSLDRRFAKLADIEAVMEKWVLSSEDGEPRTVDTFIRPFIWRKPNDVEDRTKQEPTGGAFDHLRGKRMSEVKPVQLPAKQVVWAEFRRQLFNAKKVEVVLSHGPLPMYALITAADPDAPNLLQWDNTVSWYFRHGGAPASQWGLQPGWNEVTAIFLKPCHWADETKFSHQGDGVFFALKGVCVQSRGSRGGGLFPECLRSEFHSIRSAIEAHSNQAEITGAEEGDASGIALSGDKSLLVGVDGQVYQVSLK